MPKRGQKRCRRCSYYFEESDLYSGCRLCGTCYHETVRQYRLALANLFDQRKEDDTMDVTVVRGGEAKLTSEELGVIVTALHEFVKARENQEQRIFQHSIRVAQDAAQKMAALAPGFAVRGGSG